MPLCDRRYSTVVRHGKAIRLARIFDAPLVSPETDPLPLPITVGDSEVFGVTSF